MLIKLIVVISSQYICIPYHYVVCLQIIQCYISIYLNKAGEKKESSTDPGIQQVLD